MSLNAYFNVFEFSHYLLSFRNTAKNKKKFKKKMIESEYIFLSLWNVYDVGNSNGKDSVYRFSEAGVKSSQQ